METIALVSCVKKKRQRAHPAQDLYISTLFTLSREYAEKYARKWFILSAKYGLLSPQQIIEPYEQTLNNMKKADRVRWANQVYSQMKKVNLLQPDLEILWLAGKKYQCELRLRLSDYKHVDPLEGLGIGKRLAWLKNSLASDK